LELASVDSQNSAPINRSGMELLHLLTGHVGKDTFAERIIQAFKARGF
jgi:hypothetical protein